MQNDSSNSNTIGRYGSMQESPCVIQGRKVKMKPAAGNMNSKTIKKHSREKYVHFDDEPLIIRGQL
jgi:hypothetical protein